MPKYRKNEELFEDGNRTIRFVANNGFGKAVNDLGRDISFIFADLASGLLPVQDIENIIICGMVDIDGVDIKESERAAIADDLMSRYGLQQCHQLGFVLLSHIMLGEKKSTEIEVNARLEAMAKNFLPGHSRSSKHLGWLWVAVFLTSGIAACMTSKGFEMLISYLTT